ncbi:MAG: C39 family peptidase [Elusimicrobia bacterium]|nr:C39 family peptidase [Elusimicrobiota bacterium]
MPKNVFCADYMRSYALIHAFPSDFADFKKENLDEVEFPKGLFSVRQSSQSVSTGTAALRPEQRASGSSSAGGSVPLPQVSEAMPTTGTLTSPEIKAIFPFDRIILSANAVLAGEDSMTLEIQIKNSKEQWSRWFNAGIFRGNGQSESQKEQEDGSGKMEVDVLKLNGTSEYFRYKITFKSGGADSPAVLKLAAITYANSLRTYYEKAALEKSKNFRPVKLDVPKISQAIQQVNYKGDICSPVSLAMVLSYYGIYENPIDVAAKVYDKPENIYGNWVFNTAYAGTMSLYSFVAAINTLQEAEKLLMKGIPLIASITFGPDELKNSPMNNTKGHLLVIKGFDKKGNVITNDPAAPEEKTVERVYDRAEFARAWLKNKFGVSYIINPRFFDEVTVKSSYADIYSENGVPKLIETQALMNEKLRLLETHGDRARVEALEQTTMAGTAALRPEQRASGSSSAGGSVPLPKVSEAMPTTGKNSKKLVPYAGWIQLKNLAVDMAGGFDPFGSAQGYCVVKDKIAEIEPDNNGNKKITVSAGTKFRILEKTGAKLKIMIPGGKSGFINEKHVNYLNKPLPSAEILRKKIIEATRQFLGDKYYWGGRSGFGIDCSGLVNIVYRINGIELSRNADDQFSAAKSISRENLKPGDLIFSTGETNHASKGVHPVRNPPCPKGTAAAASGRLISNGVNHVMLYAGNGRLIEATQDAGSVREISFMEKFGIDFAKAKNGMTINGRKIYFRTVFK